MLPLTLLAQEGKPAAKAEATVNAVLDDWHQAAAVADEERYFKHFTTDGVFMGTDASERWTRDEFRVWAKPHFAKGKAWRFRAVARHVVFSKDGNVAWFDEELATENMGPCRGSGVLVREGETWRIAHYNLSVPIPNDVFKDVKAIIDGYKKKAAK
ncbi:MAG: nuclear transport factor 2 family protein [Myxococcota bacterium]